MTLVRVAGAVSSADSIHARIQQRQQETWARQDPQLRTAQQQRLKVSQRRYTSSSPQWRTPTPPQPTVPLVSQPFVDPAWQKPQSRFETRRQIKLLKELGDLRASGILAESEFVTFKKRILG